ncbi:MAG: hypothetical protein RIC38_04870 [Chromatocurvus sp.]
MIISHRYRFIFIKTHKTAGSSLEMGLGPLCGEDDIISHMETNLDTGVPRNYLPDTPLGRAYGRNRWVRKLVPRHSPRLGAYYYEHMPAWRVRELVGEATWDAYFTFCIERNPWDKLVSYYLWKRDGQSRAMPPFKSWVMGRPHRLPLDAALYMADETPLVDRVFDYRELDSALRELGARTGLPLPAVLPGEKTGIARDRAPWPSYYDEESRQRVADLFRREIALMGYRFDSG